VGRPLKKIDPEKVLELAQIGCTKTETAVMLGCSVDTLDRRFAAYFELGDAQGKTQLRRKQHHRAAEDGSDNMLIFLGKNRLGQVGAQEQGGMTREQLDEVLDAIAQTKGGDPGGSGPGAPQEP
jgi:hypothetical protein